MTGQAKKRIVVLGGGCGALAAVFALTDRDPTAFDITVYQPGWRLGGKGASGRNAAHGQRIEEHGLHVWSGFYENAFWMMRKCYSELDRPSTHPMATAFGAFRPRHYTAMSFRTGPDDWDFWQGDLPHEAGLPGDAITPGAYAVREPLRTPWQLLSAFIPWALRYLQATNSIGGAGDPQNLGAGKWLAGNLLGDLEQRGPGWQRPIWKAMDLAFLGAASYRLWRAFARARRYAEAEPARNISPTDATDAYRELADRLRCFQTWAQCKQVAGVDRVAGDASVFAQIDLFAGLLAGMLRDGAVQEGFDALDGLDLRDWLLRHGVSRRSIRHPTVESIYSYIFAYVGGHPERPSLAAGVGARLLMRLLLCSRGAAFWEMHAGMGDTVFAPLYELLLRRGVKFRFFHRALEVLSLAGGQIDSVRIGRQAEVIGGTEYDPLVEVKSLRCWPSKPKTELLVQGAELAQRYSAAACDLESSLTEWPDIDTFQLKAGRDFDWLVMGVSVAAIPALCPTLMAQDNAFSDAAKHLATVRTQAVQLWFHPSLAQLGWRLPPPILTAFAKPHDTWADLSGTLEREDWPSLGPASVQYLCGVMRNDPECTPMLSGPARQARAQRSAFRLASRWLDRNAAQIWADSVKGANRRFDRSLLVSPPGCTKPASQLASQWIIANIDPSARYVQSLPGTTRYRLRADQTGYRNMVIAGDWLHTGLNFGCVEGAVIGGLQAARAICQYPAVIHGERDISAQ